MALALLVGTQSGYAQESEETEKKSLKILGIGNSFLRNATSMLPGIVEKSGHELVIGRAAPGGRTLQNHYDAAVLCETNPEDPKAKIYEYENPKYPDLPEEPNSLHGGFAWRSPPRNEEDIEAGSEDAGENGDEKLFRLDGSHANGAGSYLAACVWYEFFFEEDVRKITENPGFLGERAASLRELAHQAVKGVRPKAWPEEVE